MTKTWLRALTLVATLVLIILSGTLYFAWIEGWSHLDSYFFTVVTLSTVGYGNLVPVTVAGKIGTTVFIFLGLGVFVAAVQQFGAFAMRKREEHVDSLMAMMVTPEPPANDADTPEDPPKST